MTGGKANIGQKDTAAEIQGDALIEELLAEAAKPKAVPASPPPPVAEPVTHDTHDSVDEPAESPVEAEAEIDEDVSTSRFSWVGPSIALNTAAAWLGVVAWLSIPTLSKGLAPLALLEWVAAACIPLLLIIALWQLAMRTSTAEARRFGATARAMRAQAAALEATVARLSAKLRENQARLAEQTAAIGAMGDRAAERLTGISTGMAAEVARADAQARGYTEAVGAAQAALDTLLSSLPRAEGETRTMAHAIEAAGLAAGERAAALGAQLAALTEQGRAADQVTGDAAQKLAAHISRMEATSETASARLLAVTSDMSSSVDALLDRTANAVDEARKGIAAQGDAMLAMLETNQAALDRASRDTIDALSQRIAAVEQVIDRIAQRLVDEHVESDRLVHALDSAFSVVEARVASFHEQGIERNQTLAASISALTGSASAMNEALGTGETMARRVINTSEDLLTSLDAAAREIDETLPEALARLDARINASRGVVAAAKPEMLALVTAAESTHDAIEAIAQIIQGQRATLDQLSSMLNEALALGRERAQAIGETLDVAIGRTHDFAEEAAPRLVEALLRVRDSATVASERARETLVSVIPEAAQRLEQASAEAMARGIGNAVGRQLEQLTSLSEQAVDVATRAAEQLDARLSRISETSATVETRIEAAREERERAENEGFGRRAALLIEALNSASIDIAKSLSTDVADSAWAAYLKGDRGVFTRRAVRLLDANETREIARMHEQDADFREHVNRYIHDFEAMLRAVLTQRDGAPIGVTLLSSDMGKLYVALAQAIERLRA